MGGFAGFTGDNNLCLNSEDNINIFEKMREKIKHRGGLAPGYVKNESGNLIIFSDVSSMLSPEEILRLYEEYGGEAASKIRGGFAFVIYNAETRSLYGARDC
ncbi:MAG: hypothetical protein FWH10_04150, partial [Oscillospiraceae bacterium]|nr:hypothetical protein [Oscillospiraceae bacterium]